MAKTEREYLHAVALGTALKDIAAADLKKLHDVGAKCQWCQQGLDTWLLIQLYAKAQGIEAKLQRLEGLNERISALEYTAEALKEGGK